jgi:glycosyltransferase involved in cell wall biosynthesis
MADEEVIVSSLVSVIIPCYNHGHYLGEAIESVLAQTYAHVEVVVVDDGSTDSTAEVAAAFPQVRYVYQHNQGLSAARNAGVRHSRGELLVFLDADDWLYPRALEINARYLLANEAVAFVSGAFDRILVDDDAIIEEVKEIASNHYWHLLHGNFIGVPAAVMYRRRVFDKFMFDMTLKACEDYDLYLNVFRNYPVIHHKEKVAAYRTHSSNMSSNIPLMLASALKVLRRQKNKLATSAERNAYKSGEKFWKDYYCRELYEKLESGKAAASSAAFCTLLRYRPKLMLKYLVSPRQERAA